jgi:DNA-binding XRE family transcriptional regulator
LLAGLSRQTISSIETGQYNPSGLLALLLARRLNKRIENFFGGRDAMSIHQSVERDERSVAVENVSYKWAYFFVSFALLIDVAYRGLVRNEAAWDLMALVIVPGIVCTMYQARQKILAHGWLKAAVLIACLGGIVGFLIVAILTMTKAM